jgi:hypothetical protein
MLTAKVALEADLRAISRAAATLDGTSKSRLARAVLAVPPYGFDWSRAVKRDADAAATALEGLLKANDRADLYQQWFGEAMPEGTTIAVDDVARYQAYMGQAEAAFRLPYDLARQRIAGLEPQRSKLNPIVQRITVSLSKTNDGRQEIAVERDAVLKALR